MTTQELARHANTLTEALTPAIRWRSSFVLTFLMFFVDVLAAMFVGSFFLAMRGMLKAGAWIEGLGLVVFALVAILLVRRRFLWYHLRTPVRKAYFARRLATLASLLVPEGEDVALQEAPTVQISSRTRSGRPFQARYGVNFLANERPSMIGTAGAGNVSRLGKNAAVGTFFFRISCQSSLPDVRVSFDSMQSKVAEVKVDPSEPFPNPDDLVSAVQAALGKGNVAGDALIRGGRLECFVYDYGRRVDPMSGDIVAKDQGAGGQQDLGPLKNVADLVEVLAGG